jgi:succinate-semialdehyde dehydrogenase/glutarate-semialdehyde dehydrogenase
VAAQHTGRAPPRDRGEILRRAYEAIVARTDDFALLMTLEMGKPLAEARGEVAYGAEFFRWFSRGGRPHPRPVCRGPQRRDPPA